MSQHRQTRSAMKTRLKGIVVAVRVDPAELLSTVRSLATLPDPVPQAPKHPAPKFMRNYVREVRGACVPVG